MFESDVDLSPLHTLATKASAKKLYYVRSINDIKDLQDSGVFNEKYLILGNGSNLYFENDFDGSIIKIRPYDRNNINQGIVIIENENNQEYVTVSVSGGINWDDWVEYSIQKGWIGLENLSLIPGTVGAAPIQNIGAYGVEVKDHINQIIGWDIRKGEKTVLSNCNCTFNYRDSIFKNTLKNQFIITEVVFRLKKLAPDLSNYNPILAYGNIKKELENKEITPQEVRQTIINIRNSKIPSPKVLANAGSFFKNPVISKDDFDILQTNFEDIVAFPQTREGNSADIDSYKISAGWLIEKIGYKGFRSGNVGTYHKQALVLVNFGGATGSEINTFAKEIQEKIHKTFGITLHQEVNVY